jgi:hypothetical protein
VSELVCLERQAQPASLSRSARLSGSAMRLREAHDFPYLHRAFVYQSREHLMPLNAQHGVFALGKNSQISGRAGLAEELAMGSAMRFQPSSSGCCVPQKKK